MEKNLRGEERIFAANKISSRRRKFLRREEKETSHLRGEEKESSHLRGEEKESSLLRREEKKRRFFFFAEEIFGERFFGYRQNQFLSKIIFSGNFAKMPFCEVLRNIPACFTMALPPVQTRITSLLKCRYPIILPGMSWISTPELVAAVSNAVRTVSCFLASLWLL